MIQKRTQTEDAVSPVIGVMLMLVVTIIIAGIIAAFATGTVSISSGTPTAVLTVNDVTTFDMMGTGYYLDIVEFAHKGGSPLMLNDIRVELTCYGMVATLEPHTLSSSSGSGALSSGDILTVQASPAFIYVGGTKVEATPVSYKIFDRATNNVIASGKFIVT